MNRPFLNLDLNMLLHDGEVACLENEFVMNDNLDLALENNQHYSFQYESYPIKLSFTITIFCLSGSINIQLNLQEYQLEANDILIIMPGSIGEFYDISVNARIAFIAYTGNYFQYTTHVTESMLLQNILRTKPLCHLQEEAMQELIVIYRLMKATIKEADNPFRKGALHGYTQVLTYNAYKYLLLSEEKPPATGRNKSRQQELFDRFMVEVRQYYTQERSISFYADVLCVTPKYLSQVVHTVSGRYAGDWINDFVILEAKALIKSRKYTMQQICDLMNFANSSFFGKYFKEAVGCSPTMYQKRKY